MRIRRVNLALIFLAVICAYPMVLVEAEPASVKQLAELTASDGTAQDAFGSAVAISGNTAVVGAPQAAIGINQQEGAAYVFVKSGGQWSNSTQVAKLTPSDGLASEYFGWSVAISGNTIVVGTHPSNAIFYAAYVFVMPAGGWKDMTETAELYGNASNSFFGSSVAISGNVVVVGAPEDGFYSHSQGAAYVFIKPIAGWQSTSWSHANFQLWPPGATTAIGFGWSVSVSGATVVVGAPYAPVGTSQRQGALYVFAQSNGKGSLKATLTASDGQSGDYLGKAVAMSGSTIVGGAPLHLNKVNSYLGAAYVFVEPAAGWRNATETAALSSGMCEFGSSLGTWSTLVIAGNAGYFCNGPGSAYIFQEPKAGWLSTSTFTAQLNAADGMDEDQFGLSVAIDSENAIVGATKFGISPGAAYIF